jgi:hypothetical protein
MYATYLPNCYLFERKKTKDGRSVKKGPRTEGIKEEGKIKPKENSTR